MTRKRWVPVGCLTALTVLVVLGMCFVPWPVKVHQWDQPAGVNYGSFDPYLVAVYEVSPLLSPWPRHRIFVSKPVSPDYGHVTEYGFHHRGSGHAAHVRSCAADWSAEGVALTEPTGHRLFIPKEAFIGGR